MKKLNLGCAKKIMKGYVNVDSVKLPGVDVVQDLNKHPWKFKDNEFDEVYAKFILEHLEDNIKDMEELWRICKNKALIKIWVPYYTSHYTWDGMGHKRGYTLTAFDCFTNDNEYNHYSKVRFKIKKAEYCGGKLLKILKSLRIHKFFIKYFNNIASILYFELEVVK